MIEKLFLENFQCHNRIEIEFDQHITSIIGRTDSGKSSILRAIKWLATNRPSGSSYIRRGSESCFVHLQVDGSFLQRSRGRESNLCKLDGRIFKALGTSVPDEFRSILNVDAINWQLQHDYPFWFLLSPGEISKELNSIVNLNTIDGALFCIAGKIRSFKVEESSCKSRLEEAKKRAKDLEWVGEADKELKEIEGLSGRTESSRRKRDRLNNILLELDCLREVYRESIPFLSRFREIEKIKSKIDAINSSKERLQQLLKELTSLEESLCQTKDDYSEAKKDLEKILKKQCPLCGTLQPLQCQTCT